MHKKMSMEEAVRMPNIWEIKLWYNICKKESKVEGYLFLALLPVVIIAATTFTVLNYISGSMQHRCPSCGIPLSDDCLCLECTNNTKV